MANYKQSYTSLGEGWNDKDAVILVKAEKDLKSMKAITKIQRKWVNVLHVQECKKYGWRDKTVD